MAFKYLHSKGLGFKGHVAKTEREKFLTDSDHTKILKAVERSRKDFNQNWKRDYAAIYLGYFLGLRIGEVCLLERRHFADTAQFETAKLPTLKQGERILIECDCKKKYRVAASRGGTQYPCPRCMAMNDVPVVAFKTAIPEKEPPVIEGPVIDFVLDYIEKHMRADQQFLFEGRIGKQLSRSYMSRIFNTFLVAAGLSPKISFHSLRHGRGVKVWSMFRDLVFVRDSLRQKSTSVAERYVRFDPEERAERRKILEKNMGRRR